MDTSRISFGEMITGISGIVLFILMFLPWFGPERAPVSLSAWTSFSFIDILLFLVCVVAVALPALRAAGAMPAGLPASPGQIAALAGVIAFLLVLFRLLVPPEFGLQLDREIGVYLGLIAALGIAIGGYLAMRERASGQAPPA